VPWLLLRTAPSEIPCVGFQFSAILPIFSAHLMHSSPSRFRTVRADPFIPMIRTRLSVVSRNATECDIPWGY